MFTLWHNSYVSLIEDYAMKDLRTLAEAAKATEGSPEWYAHDEAFMEAVTPDAVLLLIDKISHLEGKIEDLLHMIKTMKVKP